MKASSQQSKRRNVLPLVAIAGASAFAASNANATIISQTELNLEIAPGSTLTDIGGITGLTIDYSNNFNTEPGGFKSALSSSGLVTNVLLPGTLVGPATVFNPVVDLTDKDTVVQAGLFGFNFDEGLGLQYGWIDISAIAGTPDPDAMLPDSEQDGLFTGTNARLFLNGWGYENQAGKSITAGATDVDEPTSLALLALGAAGLAAIRRRQKKLNA